MKKTQNVREGTRKGGFRRKKELALALCVSLWMAGGSVEAAQYLSIANYNPNSIYPGNVSVSADGKILSVTGGDWSTDWTRFKAGSNQNRNYKLNLSNATFEYDGVTLCGTSYHTRQTTGTIRIGGNAVAISDCTFNGAATIYGAYGEYSGPANATSYNQFAENTVTIAGFLGDDHLPKTRFLGATDIYAVFDEIPHNVYGRIIRQPNNRAEKNTVNLYGTTAMEKVTLHGYNDQFKISGGNELHLGGVKGDETVYAPWQGYALDNAGNVTATVNNTVNQIDRVGTIVLHQVYWNTNIPVLKATNGITNTHKMNIADMTFANADEFNAVTSGTTTLLAGTSGNFDTMSVTYKSGTDTPTERLTSENPGVVVKSSTTGSDEARGVTLNYRTGAHTVSLAENFSKVNYTIHAGNYVDTISLGTVSWSKNGTARTLAATDGYTFDAGTAINTENFAFDTPRSIGAGDSMTLLAGATGLTARTSIAHTQDFTQAAEGATLTATLSGNITRTTGALGYTAAGTALTGVNLANWNGTTAAVPTGWTAGLTAGSVTASKFTAPGTTTDILTAATENFFRDDYISAALRSISAATFNDRENGVTISGSSSSGVKASEDGKKLTYFLDGIKSVKDISLGEMAWGTSRSLEGFTCDENTALDTTNLSFASLGTGTPGVNIRKDSATALVKDASGLPGGISRDHRQEFRDYGLSNGTTMTATLTGKVTTNSDQVRYTVDDVTVSAVDLAGWTGGTTPLHWTAQAGGVDVKAEGFTFTGSTAKKNIFEAYTSNFFSDDKITGAMKYTSAAFTDDTGKGVIYSGNSYSGVKANGAYLTYFAPAKDVTTISLGGMDWGTVDADNSYNFKPAAVDASGLEFAFTPEQSAALTSGSEMTLLSNAKTLVYNHDVIAPNHRQDITGAATNGAALNGTLTGTVSIATQQKSGWQWGNVNYRATGVTLDGVDLATWDGTTAALPSGWTPKTNIPVTAAGFDMPEMAADATMNIFEAAPAGTFGAVSGARAYSATGTQTEDTAGGVTLSGSRTGGVERNGDGSNLIYHAETMTVNEISLGAMTWGTPRNGSAGGYDYSGATVDDSKLSFTNPEAVSGTGTLLTANNTLTAGSDTTHTQDFTADAVNGAALTATLSGNVTRTAGTLGYTATGTTLNKVDLAKWDGETTAAVPTGWTANLAANSVTAAGFTAPDVAAGASADILTTDTADFFSDDRITGAMKYKADAESSDTMNGVMLSGTELKGVKASADGKNLVYARSDFNVSGISLDEMEWGTPRTMAATGYDFANTATVDATNLTFTNPEAATGSTTLLSGAAGLTEGDNIAHAQAFTKSVNGATLSATLTGNVTRTAGEIGYTATGTALTGVTLANWNGATAAVPADWTANLAANSVTAAGFTAPTQTTDILTANTPSFFNDDQITGAMKYAPSTSSSDEANGVTLSGTESKGVKATDGGKKLVYARSNFNVSEISFGKMAWGTGRTAAADYDFSNTATIDASGLTFSDPEAVTGNMTLLSGAANLAAGKTVAGANHSQNISAKANGATLSGALNGTVATTSGAINYTVTGKTLSGVNLANWNGTTAALAGWTSGLTDNSITAAGFTAPTLAAGASADILTTTTNNFFNDDQITGAMKYAPSTSSSDEANGVTLSGTELKGVKASADGKNLVYARSDFNVSGISLGEMEWGTPRTMAATGYDFANTTTVDATNLTFTNPEAATGSTTLLSGAAGLTAGDNIAHAQAFTKSVNGATLSATLTGNVTRTAGEIGYTATGTALTGVNLADWNGTAAAVPADWTANLAANSVTAAGFTAPTQTTDILTTNTPSFFNDDQITGAMKYATTASSDTVNGVTLSGTESKGVKASEDGAKLVYERGNFDVAKISFGKMTWGTARDAGAASYDYANADVDLSRFTFTNPETITAGTTTLLQANETLSAVLSDVAKPFSYQYTPVAGVTVDGAVNGSVSESGNDIVYTATENKASKLTFRDVEWKDTLMARPANITFSGAAVDTSNINFTNIQSLDAGRKMTLVSDFGDTVGTITGTKYTVGTTLEGEGKASLVGNDLIFTAETGTSLEQTHNTVMGAEVGMAALSAGNDFVGTATEGLAMTTNVGADGVSSYANMGGGSMRQETGSHVDVHTWNAILALGHKNKKERGTMEYGAFFEYGSGNYTTYNGDERGDGSTHYTGGGLLAKWTAKHGLYVEGSLRAGSVHDDARNVLRDANGAPYSYETDAPYMGFHLGVGKIIPFDDIHSLDVYGKYFYNRRNGVSFDAGGHYDLDAVTSQVVRVGARYTIKQRKWDFYAGAAYEHELDGVAGGTADSVAIRGADTGGASFRGEIGATMNPGEKSPWSLGLNVSGFAGKKQGVSGGVSVSFMF